jgi:ribonuclease BN (tRNA processing enzyme)
MAHSVPTIGVRVEAGGGVLAYSADTGPAEEIVELSRGADLLIAEATWQENGEARPPIHMTAREAGEVAERAGLGELMLTHIRPYLDRDRSREEAAGAFAGEKGCRMSKVGNEHPKPRLLFLQRLGDHLSN